MFQNGKWQSSSLYIPGQFIRLSNIRLPAGSKSAKSLGFSDKSGKTGGGLCPRYETDQQVRLDSGVKTQVDF